MTIPIRSVTVTEAIVESLIERITRGEFRPTNQLPSEQSMLQEYGVSRLALREALARLVALGIISVHHGKGAFVREAISVRALGKVMVPLFPQFDVNRMNDLIEARNLIESEIAGKVAEKRTEEQIKELESLLACDSEILKNADLFAERDYAFHLALAQMADNQFFFAMFQALSHQIQGFLVRYAQSITDLKEAMDRHRPILKAIIEQDVEKARQLAREHAGICASFVTKETDRR